MRRLIARSTLATAAAIGLMTMAPWSATAAGPQELPERACNSGTQTATAHAPNRTSVEAMPHIEHAIPVVVPYCHHFNPTAEPPSGAPHM